MYYSFIYDIMQKQLNVLNFVSYIFPIIFQYQFYRPFYLVTLLYANDYSIVIVEKVRQIVHVQAGIVYMNRMNITYWEKILMVILSFKFQTVF